MFDAELKRRRQESDHALSNLLAQQAGQNGWQDLVGQWPGDETDGEIAAALEQLS